MRILNWNIEWMTHWFSGNRTPQWGSNALDAASAQTVAQKVAELIKQIGPDVLCVQEGPSALEEMQLFIDLFLSVGGAPQYEALMGRDGGSQKLYVLTKVGGAVESMDYARDAATVALDEAWQADVDGDLVLKPYEFTRMPMVVDLVPKELEPLRVVVLHSKSKYVHQGKKLWEDPEQQHLFIVEAMRARRRISAEGFRVRSYLDSLIQANPHARIVVTGDWNDGPGTDFFERQYLTHNVADIILGSTFYPDLIFHHPLLQHVPSAERFTARFDDFIDDKQDRPLLLDHFAISPALRDAVADAGIAHQEYERQLGGPGEARTQRASDHRPIWLELNE